MKGATVVVVGFGLTGKAVARSLVGDVKRLIVLEDAATVSAEAQARAMNVQLQTTPVGTELEQLVAGTDLIVPSPGVPVSHPIYSSAASAGVPVLAEIELAARRAAARGAPELVAITGTNGKTTVTTLVTSMLKASGVKAIEAGNIGVPMIEAVESGADTVVVEVSSFQLQYTDTFHPSVSCWLNLAEDHLDWHPDLAHYAAAKAKIWANQGVGDTAVVNADDPAVSEAAATVPNGVTRRTFSTRISADYRLDRDGLVGPSGELIARLTDLPPPFPHDVSNSLAACAVALSAGATIDGCRAGLTTTGPLPHRVSQVGSRDGVSWYDDSKATTPASVVAAVSGFESVVLIAGGRNKGLDLSVLSSTVPPVRAVVAIGESAPDVKAVFENKVPVVLVESMQAAVDAAASLARDGDAVLLSPGCASFDWYTSYAARGDDFAARVNRYLVGKGSSC